MAEESKEEFEWPKPGSTYHKEVTHYKELAESALADQTVLTIADYMTTNAMSPVLTAHEMVRMANYNLADPRGKEWNAIITLLHTEDDAELMAALDTLEPLPSSTTTMDDIFGMDSDQEEKPADPPVSSTKRPAEEESEPVLVKRVRFRKPSECDSDSESDSDTISLHSDPPMFHQGHSEDDQSESEDEESTKGGDVTDLADAEPYFYKTNNTEDDYRRVARTLAALTPEEGLDIDRLRMLLGRYLSVSGAQLSSFAIKQIQAAFATFCNVGKKDKVLVKTMVLAMRPSIPQWFMGYHPVPLDEDQLNEEWTTIASEYKCPPHLRPLTDRIIGHYSFGGTVEKDKPVEPPVFDLTYVEPKWGKSEVIDLTMDD